MLIKYTVAKIAQFFMIRYIMGMGKLVANVNVFCFIVIVNLF